MTHGRCTVHRAAVPPHGVSGCHEPDPRRVSAAGPALCDRVPMPDGGVAGGWAPPDRSSVYRVQQLPLANSRGSVIVSSDVYQDLRAARGPGSPVRHGPEYSQPVDSRAPARPPRGTPRPWGCSCPLPHSPGTAARHLRGHRRYRGHPDRGVRTRRRRTYRHTGGPPFAHDGTERRIVHPHDPVEQQESYSGKKKDNTVKNVLLVNAFLTILFLSDTHGGRTHDLRIAEATPTRFRLGVGGCRIWASCPSRSPRWKSSCRRRSPAVRS